MKIEYWESITVRPLNGRIGVACNVGGVGLGFLLDDINSWLARAFDVFGSVGGFVQVVVERDSNGILKGLRHPLSSELLPFTDVKYTPVQPKRDDVSEALAFINAYRRQHTQRPLDPAQAGWNDDDVLIEAKRLGWLHA